MSISKNKLILIFVVIITVLFERQFITYVNKSNEYYNMRDVNNVVQNSDLPADYKGYDSYDYNEKYIIEILNILENDINSDISNYLNEHFYDLYKTYENIDLKELFKENILIKNKDENEYYITYRTDYINENEQIIKIFDVIVIKKNMNYPNGYDILKIDNDIDKNKRVSFHVIEKGPYDIKIYKVIK